LVQILLSEYAIEGWLNFPPHLFRVRILPWETFKTLKIMNLASNCTYLQYQRCKCKTIINSKILLSLIVLFYLFIMQFLDWKEREQVWLRQWAEAACCWYLAVCSRTVMQPLTSGESDWEHACVHGDEQHSEHLLW